MENRIDHLLERYCNGLANVAETEELMEFIRLGDDEESVQLFMDKAWSRFEERYQLSQGQSDRVYAGIINKAAPVVHMPVKTQRSLSWTRMVAAAVILLVLATAAFFYFNKPGKTGDEIVRNGEVKDVQAPQITKATITLADGRVVTLDQLENGTIAQQQEVNIIKTENGEIVYEGSQTGAQLSYNTLTNPRGSKVISLVLADGSKVWLNSESSITYPVAFAGDERKVEITGEAYFEVASRSLKGNEKLPFIVSSGDLSVTVLGTHFNIKAFEDEPEIKVTLLEGLVRVSQNQAEGSKILKPGEQAQFNPDLENYISVFSNVDVEEVMAWKNGKFSYKSADLRTIMKEISRWYDVEIVFEKQVNEKFYANISRSTNLSNLLKVLEATNVVHFTIEGKKVIVRP